METIKAKSEISYPSFPERKEADEIIDRRNGRDQNDVETREEQKTCHWSTSMRHLYL